MQLWVQTKILPLFNETFALVLIVSILEISGGAAFVWTSPILPKLESNNTQINPLKIPINKTESSWISSCLLIGQLCISIPFSASCNRIGRKPALLLTALFFIIANLMLGLAQNVILLYAGRCLLGIALGIECIILPMYVVEIGDDTNRGMLITTTNIFGNLGVLLTYSLGHYLSVMWFSAVLVCIPAVFLVLFAVFGKESPYYLVQQNKISEAENVLKQIDKNNAKQKILELQEKAKRNSDNKTNLTDLFKTRKNLKSIAIVLILTASKQMSGTSIFLFYAQDIFSNISVSIPAHVYPIITGLISFMSSFICPFFVDSLGRRPFLIISFVGMAVSNFSLGTYFHLQNVDTNIIKHMEFVPVISSVVYTLFKNVGIGSLMWTITCELFPHNLHSYALCVYTTFGQVMILVSTHTFQYIIDWVGKGETFGLYGLWCVCTLVLFCFLPETKGKNFSDIQEEL